MPVFAGVGVDVVVGEGVGVGGCDRSPCRHKAHSP